MPTHAPDCSCPQKRRTFSRRKMQDGWRRDTRWKKMLEDHAYVPGAVCAHCGMSHGQQRYDSKGNPLLKEDRKTGKLKPVLVTLTINHKDRGLYANADTYLTWDPDRMEICCTICNREYEKGNKPCPDCLKAGFVRYIKWYDSECTACYYQKHPEEKEKHDTNVAAFKEGIRQFNKTRAQRKRTEQTKHPCAFRMSGQRCRLGGACEHSPAKAAAKCKRGFKQKKNWEKKVGVKNNVF